MSATRMREREQLMDLIMCRAFTVVSWANPLFRKERKVRWREKKREKGKKHGLASLAVTHWDSELQNVEGGARGGQQQSIPAT